jgi:hypothetical protein
MSVVNRSGVWGVLIAAVLAWLPVLILDGGAAEYFAGFVFVAAAYASWTDRWPLEISDPARRDLSDWPNWPDPAGTRIAVFGTVPLLFAPFLALVVVLVYLCFTGFEWGRYPLPLYFGVFVASLVVAALTARRRNFVVVHESARLAGRDGRTAEPNG